MVPKEGLELALKTRINTRVLLFPSHLRHNVGPPTGDPMATFDKRDGKWRVQVRRTGYKAQCKTFTTKSAGEKWARELEAQLDRGVEHDTGELRRVAVSEILSRFLTEEVPLRKGRRWEEVRINFMLRADFARHRLDQNLVKTIREWCDQRLTECSPATVNRDLNLLSGIFRTAIKKWGIPLDKNPIHDVARPKVDGRSRGQVWTAEAVQKLRDAAAAEDRRAESSYTYVVPALELAVESAMRLGEVCSIEARNVHLSERYVLLDETKNGDSRRVPLSTKAAEILELLLQGKSGEDLVFPVSKDVLGLRFRQLRAKAGLAGLRFHDARHTAATRASKVLHNVLELAAFTGHRSLQSLKRYYHADATDLAKRLG